MIFRRPSKWRTLLVLGRVSNLPTVWSDCLAGWWLSGAGTWERWAIVTGAASSLYVGGMFLNDAFDADFDRVYRRNRPIPGGAIDRKEVWRWGYFWLALGLAILACLNAASIDFGLALCGCILLYNRLHKALPVSPILMGTCRFLLYILAAASGPLGLTGEIIWKGVALASYIAGLSWLARAESKPARLVWWPVVFLAAPLVIAACFDDGDSARPALIYSVLLTVWTAWALSRSFGRRPPHVGFTISRLLAGICLVDLLAVAVTAQPGLLLFAFWLALALLLQRFIPAT